MLRLLLESGPMDEGSPRCRQFGPADIVSLAALAALALALGLAPLTSNDIWLHLATGDWILQHGRVPGEEVFSFVAAGRPYVAHEWGSQVLLALAYRLAGLGGLQAFKTLVALALGWALYLTGRRAGANSAAAAAAAGAALFVAGAHLWARPHLLTWLALLATLAILKAAPGAGCGGLVEHRPVGGRPAPPGPATASRPGGDGSSRHDGCLPDQSLWLGTAALPLRVDRHTGLHAGGL